MFRIFVRRLRLKRTGSTETLLGLVTQQQQPLSISRRWYHQTPIDCDNRHGDDLTLSSAATPHGSVVSSSSPPPSSGQQQQQRMTLARAVQHVAPQRFPVLALYGHSNYDIRRVVQRFRDDAFLTPDVRGGERGGGGDVGSNSSSPSPSTSATSRSSSSSSSLSLTGRFKYEIQYPSPGGLALRAQIQPQVWRMTAGGTSSRTMAVMLRSTYTHAHFSIFADGTMVAFGSGDPLDSVYSDMTTPSSSHDDCRSSNEEEEEKKKKGLKVQTSPPSSPPPAAVRVTAPMDVSPSETELQDEGYAQHHERLLDDGIDDDRPPTTGCEEGAILQADELLLSRRQALLEEECRLLQQLLLPFTEPKDPLLTLRNSTPPSPSTLTPLSIPSSLLQDDSLVTPFSFTTFAEVEEAGYGEVVPNNNNNNNASAQQQSSGANGGAGSSNSALTTTTTTTTIFHNADAAAAPSSSSSGGSNTPTSSASFSTDEKTEVPPSSSTTTTTTTTTITTLPSYVDFQYFHTIVLAAPTAVEMMPFAFCLAELIQLRALGQLLIPLSQLSSKWKRYVQQHGRLPVTSKEARKAKAQVLRISARHSKMGLTRHRVFWESHHALSRSVFQEACTSFEVHSLQEELKERSDGLANTLAYLCDEAHADTNHRLEWVVIALICVEVLISLQMHPIVWDDEDVMESRSPH